MVEADVGRIPIVDRDSHRLAGLVARKNLLRIRAVTNRLERDRMAFYSQRAAKGAKGSELMPGSLQETKSVFETFYCSARPKRQTTAYLVPAWNGEEIGMLKVIAWIIGIIFLIGLLVVFGVLDLIF